MGIDWATSGRLGVENAVEVRSTGQPMAAVPG